MSADDNLRDALIEAFRKEIHDQGFWPDDSAQPDPAGFADVAIKVIKDWTVDAPQTPSGS